VREEEKREAKRILSSLNLPNCPHWLAVSRDHGARAGIDWTDWISSHVSTLRMKAEMVIEMLVFSPFNH